MDVYQNGGVAVDSQMLQRARKKSVKNVEIQILGKNYRLVDSSKFRMGLAKLGILTVLGCAALANNVVEAVVSQADAAVSWVQDSSRCQDAISDFQTQVISPNTFRTSSDGAYMDTVNYNYSGIASMIRDDESSAMEGIYKLYQNDRTEENELTNEVVRILSLFDEEVDNLDDFLSSHGYDNREDWGREMRKLIGEENREGGVSSGR